MDLQEVTFKEPKNAFEKSLTAFLTESGYKTHLKVGMNNFYVDLAVINPKDETKYLLAIELDAPLNKALYSARDKECTRPVVLKMLGWHVYRIWSKDWFYNQAYEKEKLLTYLKELQ